MACPIIIRRHNRFQSFPVPDDNLRELLHGRLLLGPLHDVA
jgi:hypothetical protein